MLADVVALEQIGDAMEAEASDAPPSETLNRRKHISILDLEMTRNIAQINFASFSQLNPVIQYAELQRKKRPTEALTTLYPANLASLCKRWCVLPNVMHGQQHVMAHVSIGVKHSKNELDQEAEPVGWVMPEGSLETWEARATQLSMSDCIADLGWVGAAMVRI